MTVDSLRCWLRAGAAPGWVLVSWPRLIRALLVARHRSPASLGASLIITRPAPRHCDTQQLVTTAGTNPALWRQCLAPAPALFCCPGRVCTSECPTTAAANHRRRRGLCCRSPHQRHGRSSAAVGVALCEISNVATLTWTIVQVYIEYFISKQKNHRKSVLIVP